MTVCLTQRVYIAEWTFCGRTHVFTTKETAEHDYLVIYIVSHNHLIRSAGSKPSLFSDLSSSEEDSTTN